MAGPQFLELFIGVRIPAPEELIAHASKYAQRWDGDRDIMDIEYFRADDVITLTPGEWQELVSSIQNLVQANTALLQTVSELMAQRNQAISEHTVSAQPIPIHPAPAADPYDLRTLNHLLNDSSQ